MNRHSLDPDPLPSCLKHLIAGLFRLELADPDAIDDHAPIFGGNLGLDSLDAIELGMCIEEEFGVTLRSREESLHALTSIASLAGFIRARTPAVRPVVSRPASFATLLPSS